MMSALPAASERPLSHFNATNRSSSPSRWFLIAALLWSVLGTALAAWLGLWLVVPHLFYELGEEAQYLSYGRHYPLQWICWTYGLAGNAFFALAYSVIQGSSKRSLRWSGLVVVHWLAWQAWLVACGLSLLQSDGRGYWFGWIPAELELWSALVWLACFVPVLFGNLRSRESQTRIAPALWFVLLTTIAFPLLAISRGLATTALYDNDGIQSLILHWWTARGLTSYLLISPAVAALYVLVPRLGTQTIYSHRLTVIHLWSLAILGAWGGGFHWHYTLIPEWLDSLAMFAGLLLWFGCLAGAYNLWRSLPASKAQRSAASVLTRAALVFYTMYCMDSLYLSMKASSLNSQFTDWAVANQLLAILGVTLTACLAFALRNTTAHSSAATPTWPRTLAQVTVGGITLQIVASYMAGMTQAYSWHQLDSLGRLQYPEFANSLIYTQPLWAAAVIGCLVHLLATLLWLVAMLGRGVSGAVAFSGAGGASATPSNSDPQLEPSPLVSAPVLGMAIGLQHWSQLVWHATLERRPGTFAARIAVAFAVGLIVIWLPSFAYRDAQASSAAIMQNPLTPLESLGQQIYLREGCSSCHTQASRPLVAEVLRYGNHSHAVNYSADAPPRIGYRRVGPDLAFEGGRRTSLWHWLHLENPQSQTPESVMPAFDHILKQRLPDTADAGMTTQAEAIVADIVAQGGPATYGTELLIQSRGIALIAYLQRLGVAGTATTASVTK